MSVPFELHTVSPVTEFEEQELTTPGVGIDEGAGVVGSSCTTWRPVLAVLHAPFGTYEVTFGACTSTPNELDGKHVTDAIVHVIVLGVNMIFLLCGVGVASVAVPVSVYVPFRVTP